MFIKINAYVEFENQQVKFKKGLKSQNRACDAQLEEGNETTQRDEVAGYSLNLEGRG